MKTEKMHTFCIYFDQEWEKYEFLTLTREAGGQITDVSGCGNGYYIEILATPTQREYITRRLYTAELDALPPREIWHRWKSDMLSVGQVCRYQERHQLIFSARGEVIRA